MPLYWDAARGRVLIEVPAFDRDVLYYVSAASGAGSVELPFDRGILATEVIHFQRSGPRVLVVAQNLRYRAVGGSAAQAENVRDSFATSVLASLPVEADEGSRVVVDATPLFLRDAADVEGRLRRANQGAFRFDAGRSGFHAPRIKSFPLNAEVETIVTFAADNPGLLVNNVTPDGRAFTLRIHHSFLRAPEGYTPRVADPRIGVSTIAFRDYARPVNEDTEVQWITRWRLEKRDPAAAMSEPKVPIVFYLDAGIPEPTADGDARGRAVVEQGLRGRRFPQRRPGARSHPRHGSDGHPLRVDPVDQPRRARLLERRHLPRSAHRRDPRVEDADGLAPHPHHRQLLGELHADHRRRRRRRTVPGRSDAARGAGAAGARPACRRRNAIWCCCASRC